MTTPLMPLTTAVWLVDNTTLSFKQIAEYCDLHELEIQAIADGDVASSVRGQDPVTMGELTREEIERCEQDHEAPLTSLKRHTPAPRKRSKGPRYTPIAKREEKPDAIAWLLRNYPDIKDNQIIKLIGTTKNTINALRKREHWNMSNIRPRDPVLLGLCSQSDLDSVIKVMEDARAKAQPEKYDNEDTAKPDNQSAEGVGRNYAIPEGLFKI